MLKSLTVENYALIEKTDVQWNPGFSVITGETGSGKSILLGALGLIQGQRADTKALKDTEKKCVVEAEFDLSAYALQPFFKENDLDYEETCIIRREIAPNGKSRAFINDTPVALSALKEITSHIIDIHSQHETLLLNEDAFQLHVLDAYANLKEELSAYGTIYGQYAAKKKRLKELRTSLEERNANRDYLEFQLKQLHDAGFSANEQEELEEEINVLSHTSEMKDALSKTNWLLSDKEENICGSLKEVTSALSSIAQFSESFAEMQRRADSCLIELKDLARSLKQKCGVGGSVKDFCIEIQGDKRNILKAELEKKGYVVKLAGG